MSARTIAVLGVSALVAAVSVAAALAGGGQHTYGPWVAQGTVPGQVNTADPEGCPIVAPNDKDLYIASVRASGMGANDIYVAHRKNKNAPWGEPVSMGEPVNSTASDYCPSPMKNGVFLFVSTRAADSNGFASCGGADMYLLDTKGPGPARAVNLGCTVNSAGSEWSPYLLQSRGHTWLFFSSDGHGGQGGQDIFSSYLGKSGFEDPVAVPGGVNTAANEFRPNLRFDGLEIVFDSDRMGGMGATDVYSATRTSLDGDWSAATAENAANTPAGESRASMSWDGKTLYWGSAGDIYYATRTKNK